MSAAPLSLRLRAHWPLKALLGGLGSVLFFTAYFVIQAHPLRPPLLLPWTACDALIPQAAWAVFPYLSLAIFTQVPTWLLAERPALLRWHAVLTLIAVIGLGIFLVFPTTIDRPASPAGSAVLAWLVRIDGPGNACPSLHAAFTAATLVVGWRLSDIGVAFRLAITGWALAILAAILLTKQHTALDVALGLTLGVPAGLLWRRPA